jgi:hypothetical protein
MEHVVTENFCTSGGRNTDDGVQVKLEVRDIYNTWEESFARLTKIFQKSSKKEFQKIQAHSNS